MQGGVSCASRERPVLIGLLGLAFLGCFLGLAFRPAAGGHVDVAHQAFDLVRVMATAALAVVLVLGPGLVLRASHFRGAFDLGFVPLPGLVLLAVTGCLAWVLATPVHARVVCTLVFAPVLLWLLSLLRAGPEDALSNEERRALGIVAAALGVAIARTLWSLGPSGELLGGTAFRTLEVGDRSDSRVPFGVVQLVANGESPFGGLARAYFQGYTFSDRGPLAGLASAPIVLLTGVGLRWRIPLPGRRSIRRAS